MQDVTKYYMLDKDFPCEYGKDAGKCKHDEVISENGSAKNVYFPHCRNGICKMWEPNQVMAQVFFSKLKMEEDVYEFTDYQSDLGDVA